MAWLKWRGTPERGRWYAVWTETVAGKKRKRFRAVSRERKAAETVLAEINLNIKRKSLGLGAVVSFAQMSADYLRLLASNGCAKSYLERLGIALGHLERHYPNVKLPAVTAKLLDDFKLKRIGEKIGGNTINREISFIKALVKKAKRFQYQFNDLSEVEKVRTIEKARPGFKPDEIGRILSESKRHKPLYIVAMLGLYAGLRRSEIIALRWADIDAVPGVITLGDGWKTKSGSMRAVPIHKALAAALADLRRVSGTSPHIVGWKGSPHTLSSRFTYFLRNLAGVPRGSLHGLRHTFITELKRRDMDTGKIQRLAGHKNEKTTQGYIHLDTADLKEGIDRLSFE